MIDLYSKKSLIIGSSIFDKSVLYTVSPNKVFFLLLNVNFTKYLHFLINLQAKYVPTKQARSNPI